jgi:cellulose biosynthesis protein BcsQ
MGEAARRGQPRLARAYARLIRRERTPPVSEGGRGSYRVITVANPKGGVGKTTLATNLAVYLRALCKEREVLVLGLDDQSLIDRMFAEDAHPPRTWRTVPASLRAGSFASAIRAGRYGVHYVPSGSEVRELNRSLTSDSLLHAALQRTAWEGLVIVDTKGDLDVLTQSAIAASDLVLIPVRDDPSLREAAKIFDWMTYRGCSRERARIVLSMVDLRVKYREGEVRDLLSLLLGDIRRRSYPLYQSFLSSSPAVEALSTNPEGRPRPILEGAPGSLVHQQMLRLTQEVLELLGESPSASELASPG